MNSAQLNNLLLNSENVDASSSLLLENIIHEFPFFQAAKAIQLKQFKKSNNFKYNETLKKVAAHTIDRQILFEYITSPNFEKKSIQEFEILEEIEVIEPETVKILHQKISTLFTKKQPKETEVEIPVKTKNLIPQIEETTTENEDTEKASELLEIGKPLQFKSSEPHSFNEWMQLISKKPIEREEKPIKPEEISLNTTNKFSLIDKFIESNPKIKPVDKLAVNIDISKESSYQNESLMTETLAKVYLEQKKYDNAIKAYHILCLKYPEKSSFFANRIKAIKILQKNKS